MLFCTPAGSNSLAISAKASRTDKLPYPHKRPVAYGTNRLTPAAAAGIPVRFAHSNVVGNLTVPPTNAPLPDRFYEGFPGIAKESPAARRAKVLPAARRRRVAYWAGIRYHIDNGIFSPGGWESRNRIYL